MATRKRDHMVDLPPIILDAILRTLPTKDRAKLDSKDKLKILFESADIASLVVELIEERTDDTPTDDQ